MRMKVNCLFPLVMALLAFTLPSWGDSTAHDAAPVDNMFTTDNQGTEPLPAPADAVPGLVSGTISMPSLDLSLVDVGMDFLVQETVVGSSSVYGVGMMFTLKSP